jgi:alkaline phosphatase D
MMIWLCFLTSSAAIKIAFGSCHQQNLTEFSEPVWRSISDAQADHFIWLGDAIYGDKRITLGFVARPPSELQEFYQKTLTNPDYVNMKKSLQGEEPKVVGIYDDHDLGLNNVDGSFQGKFVNKPLYMDFIGEPAHSARRSREGAYAAYEMKGGKVLLILLDVRWFANKTAETLLGAVQWAFLESTLANSSAALIIIGSPIQVLSSHLAAFSQEGWVHFAADRRRLIALLNRQTARVLIVSGDVHYGELSCLDNVWEATSSGLSMALGDSEVVAPMPRNTVVHSGVFIAISNMLTSMFALLPAGLGASEHWRWPYRTWGEASLFERNYGIIEFDETSRRLRVSVHDRHGRARVHLDSDTFACANSDADARAQPAQALVALATTFWALVVSACIRRCCRARAPRGASIK